MEMIKAFERITQTEGKGLNRLVDRYGFTYVIIAKPLESTHRRCVLENKNKGRSECCSWDLVSVNWGDGEW